MSTKERPILFSGPMVRAILEGRKTQTRRIIKPQPTAFWNDGRQPVNLPYDLDNDKIIHCPYGKPGDRLLVRETFRLPVTFDNQSPRAVGEKCVDSGYRKPWAPVRYEADGDDKFLEMLHDFGGKWGKTRVSIHMPRWLSRITLEVVSVRVERLQDISEADAKAEGIQPSSNAVYWMDYSTGIANVCKPQFSYMTLWESINGPKSWTANPWVWVVEFNRVEATQ